MNSLHNTNRQTRDEISIKLTMETPPTRKLRQMSRDTDWLQQYRMEPRFGYQDKALSQRSEKSLKKQKCMLRSTPTISIPRLGAVPISSTRSSSEQRHSYNDFSSKDGMAAYPSENKLIDNDDFELIGLAFVA